MELYQRIKRVANEIAGSETKLAEKIGMGQKTLNSKIRLKKNDDLKAILDRVLMAYPEISREWLYFDEGEMLTPGGSPTVAKPFVTALTREAKAAQEADARVRELEAEVVRLQRELLDSKDKIIALYEQHHGGEQRDTFTPGAGGAPIGTSAARMSRPGIDGECEGA